jgi:hypothetical protein
MKQLKNIWLNASTILLLFTACNSSENPRFLGKLAIKNIPDKFFRLYQEDKFDSSVPIYFEIVDNQDRVLYPINFLIGTSDFDRHDTKDFFTGTYDSIIYLSFINPDDIYAMYDLKSQQVYPCYSSDTLNIEKQFLERLKKSNPNLKLY